MTPLTGALDRLVRWLGSVHGRNRWAISFVLGAAAAFAQPPFHVLPVLIVSFTGLVWLLDGTGSRRSAFAVGWMFGAGYFAVGLYWVSNAFLVDAARFGWMIPFVVLGLSLGLGLFGGVATWTARFFWSPGVGRIFALAASWTLLELARGLVLTGFPWNPVGNVWVAAVPVLQGAAWIGVFGLSAVTVFAAAGFALFGSSGRWKILSGLSGTAILCVMAVAGEVRLSSDQGGAHPGVVLRIVQPNIAQRDKWKAGNRAANYALQLQMSGERGDGKATHVIWPETAAPFSVPTDAARRDLMRRSVPPGGYLITGTPRFEHRRGRLVGAWNSLVAVGPDASVAAVYDKHHLVPFGEYVPFRDVLPLEKITTGSVDFSAGPGAATITLPGLPAFSPLICYEAIFPGEVALRHNRPEWLLNITNDAWFGASAGPHQHFASARLRAVEEGLPLVRAANTGISGVVDPYGRVVGMIGLGKRGVLDAALPVATSIPTPFSLHGNIIPALIIASMFLASIFGCINNRLRENETN